VPNPPAARRLSVRDREVLWMMSQGMTYFEVGRKLGMAEQGAKSAARRAMGKLGARNIVHAVTISLLSGEIGRWRGCGSHAAYQRHRKLHQTADPACLMGKAEYDRGYRAGEEAGPFKASAVVSPGQEYRHAVTGRTIRIESVDTDRVRVCAVDVETGRVTRVLTDTFYTSRWTSYGAERRTGYVLIRK
jgi:DNA-binding CsgD family transcriptional regulator